MQLYLGVGNQFIKPFTAGGKLHCKITSSGLQFECVFMQAQYCNGTPEVEMLHVLLDPSFESAFSEQ